MNVLFLGGSNTWGAGADDYANSYAGMTAVYLENRFPGVRICNTAIGGTGTRLCAFQIDRLVRETDPDIAFIEYSINDSGLALNDENQVLVDTEYVVRSILAHNPKAYILMLLFAKQDFRSCTATHAKIAEHYGLDYIELQEPMRELTNNAEKWIEYFVDAVHPNSRGYKFYFDHIKAFLESKADGQLVRNAPVPAHYVAPIYKNPQVIDAETYLQSPIWTRTTYRDIKYWDSVYIHNYLHCNTPNVPVAFTFTGHTFGLYHLVRNDGGKLKITVDGTDHILDTYYNCDGDFVSFFNLYDLGQGEHTVSITLLSEHNEHSIGITAGIYGFLID